MAFNAPANRAFIIRNFPLLAADPHFELTSDATVRYNCIAFAMGFDDRWVQPHPDNRHFCWWPDGATRDCTPDALCEAFESIGFLTAADDRYDPELDKVVLYSLGNIWTHAARIVCPGVEHSKFGESWDGRHGSNLFDGTGYGTPYAIMQRPKTSRAELMARYPLPGGTVTSKTNLLRRMLGR